MNDRLKTIVDLENYPIHDLSSSKIQKLIKKCKSKDLTKDISNKILNTYDDQKPNNRASFQINKDHSKTL